MQPGSSQELLLGTNTSLSLGLKFLDDRGRPLQTSHEPEFKPQTASVCLVQATGGRFVRVRLPNEFQVGDQFLFEPENGQLQSMELSAVDSLLSVNEKGEVLIPVCNLRETRTIVPESRS